MRKFKIKAFCKINLFLRVIKRLNNGYHDIRSLVTFCDLFDEISVKTLNGEKDDIAFSGKFKKGINKKVNTITKVLGIEKTLSLSTLKTSQEWKTALTSQY